MKIYDKNDIELLDVDVTDESYRLREIMSSPTLVLYFSLNQFIELPVDAYCDFNGQRFFLFDPKKFVKNSTKDFEDTLVMYGIAEKLNRFRFYDYANGGLKFTLTATPQLHVEMLVNVLNAKDSGWTVGTVVDSSEIVVDYSHNSCMEALGLICDKAETEFEITDGKVINLRKTEYNKADPLALSYGPGNGLKPGAERRNDQNGRPIERLFVQGGDRNIDYSTYGSRYLLLPKSQTLVYNGNTYQVSADGLYIQRSDKALTTGQEGSLDASTIYPSRIGVVTAVDVVDADNNLFNIEDSTIPAALNFSDYLIAGETMTIVYQSGSLTGKEFDVSYDHENRTFEIVPKDIDGYTMPSLLFTPAIGDTYVVFGCSFPDAYIRDDATESGASWDMFREAVTYMYEHEEDKYSYGGNVSPIWMKANYAAASVKMIPGGYCSLTDPEFGDVLIRIRSIKDYVTYKYDIEIDLSNALVKASIASTLAKINAYTASLTVQQLLEARDAAAANGIDVSYLENLIKNYYPSFADITGSPTDNDALYAWLQQIGLSGNVDTQTKLISGSVVWKEGMTFETTDFLYKILGTYYTCPATTLALTDSDATYGRIDVFYLDTFGNINIKTGTPSANPLEPTLGELELYVSSVYIPANALEPSGISLEKIYDELAVEEWTPTATNDAGNTTIQLDDTEDPYSGIKHIKVALNVPDVVSSLPQHYIGEHYQGGIIFWIDPTDSRKGMIAATSDTIADIYWSRLHDYATYTTGATGTAIGTGANNSALMLALPAANNSTSAIKWVDEFKVIENGVTYDDWFIGSKEEMKMLWKRRYTVGGFNPGKDYWTSTEEGWDYAGRIDWETGDYVKRKKNTRRNIRAIREFDDSIIPTSSPVDFYTPQDTNIVFQAPEEVLAAEGILSFKMKTSAEWRVNSILRVEMYKGAVRVGSCAISPATELFGFNIADFDNYQMVAVYHANFAPSQNKFDGLKISLIGSWPNGIELFIDSIRFQHTTQLQERAVGAVLQVQDQVIYAADWQEGSGFYYYEYFNPNIKATSTVDIIPVNDDIDLVLDAVMYPEINSSEGKATIYAVYIPANDIRVTVNITEATL